MRYGRITDPAELDAYRVSMLPKDRPFQKVKSKLGAAIAYTWSDNTGRFSAIAWLGKSQHPYSGNASRGGIYWFKTEDKRRAWITECFSRAAGHAESKAKRASESAVKRAQPHKLAIGDILRASWGYDQTNIDYYQVTALIGARMVEIREIGSESEGSGYGGTGVCVPAPGSFCGEPMRKMVCGHDNASVKIESYAFARKIEPVITIGTAKVFESSHWSADH